MSLRISTASRFLLQTPLLFFLIVLSFYLALPISETVAARAQGGRSCRQVISEAPNQPYPYSSNPPGYRGYGYDGVTGDERSGHGPDAVSMESGGPYPSEIDEDRYGGTPDYPSYLDSTGGNEPPIYF